MIPLFFSFIKKSDVLKILRVYSTCLEKHFGAKIFGKKTCWNFAVKQEFSIWRAKSCMKIRKKIKNWTIKLIKTISRGLKDLKKLFHQLWSKMDTKYFWLSSSATISGTKWYLETDNHDEEKLVVGLKTMRWSRSWFKFEHILSSERKTQ